MSLVVVNNETPSWDRFKTPETQSLSPRHEASWETEASCLRLRPSHETEPSAWRNAFKSEKSKKISPPASFENGIRWTYLV